MASPAGWKVKGCERELVGTRAVAARPLGARGSAYAWGSAARFGGYVSRGFPGPFLGALYVRVSSINAILAHAAPQGRAPPLAWRDWV